MRTALLAAYTKDETLVSFARQLKVRGWNLLGSAGTAKFLNEAGVPVRDVAEIVGPPILGHRVVTLAREIYAALLADVSKPEDMAELKRIGIEPISMVYVTLYPLKEEMERDGRTISSVIEKIDIGGPTLLRAAAKGARIVLSDPDQFEQFFATLDSTDDTEKARIAARFAAEAESRVSTYANLAARFYRDVEAVYDDKL